MILLSHKLAKFYLQFKTRERCIERDVRMKEMYRMSDHVGRIYLKTKRKEFPFISITRLPCVLLQTHVSSRRRRSLRVHATSRRNIRVYQDHVLPIASYTRGQCCCVRDRPSGSYKIPGVRKS